MAMGALPLSQLELSMTVNSLIDLVTELQTTVNALRADFRAHDHGNTASYAQEAITIRATPATITGTESCVPSACAAPSDLPVPMA